MDLATVLLHILVVVLAAKVAAEISERVRVPTVVGEIVAGILIGPSVFGLVRSDDVVTVLGQLGVILLLLQVGLETDLGELRSVGRASVLVACAGVAAPLVLGLGAATAFGYPGRTALFLGAALTATSVGITARVFNDLRALGTPEARTVLGAAVADDVIGLVILTVVVRVVSSGSVSPSALLGVIGVAVGFLAVAGILGVRFAPRVFTWVDRRARSTATLVGVVFAFALAVAELADRAQLAPIVGAFVAGVALAGAPSQERIRRELTPIGHLLIPVFFLQIGIDVHLTAFARPSVLVFGSVLVVVAVIGKLLSPIGAIGSPGDKWLIGLGMIPRGEVGIIFATIGLQSHVLDQSLYAAVLLVVLATTLVTPPLLRWRSLALAARRRAPVAGGEPVGGWWRVADGLVHLTGVPPDHLVLPLALEGALLVRDRRPAPSVLDGLAGRQGGAPAWSPRARELLFEVLREGSERSWRFLELAGTLDRALPELAELARARPHDPFDLEAASVWRWSLVDAIREVAANDPVGALEFAELVHPGWLLFAGLIIGSTGDGDRSVVAARRSIHRLDLGARAEQHVALLVGEADLLIAAARRSDPTAERSVLTIAAHLDRPERARALYLLTIARSSMSATDRGRLDALYGTVQDALVRPDLTGLEARNMLGGLRAAAQREAGPDRAIAERIAGAPRTFVTRPSAHLAAAAVAIERARQAGLPAIDVVTAGEGAWRVQAVGRDAPGLLARLTGVLRDEGFDVEDALVATWPDKIAYDQLTVRATGATSGAGPTPSRIRDALRHGAGHGSTIDGPIRGVEVELDDRASPWATICRVRVAEPDGSFGRLAAGLADAGANIVSATLRRDASGLAAEFELTDELGAKLDDRLRDAVRWSLTSGARARRGARRPWKRRRIEAVEEPRSRAGFAARLVTRTKHRRRRSETVLP